MNLSHLKSALILSTCLIMCQNGLGMSKNEPSAPKNTATKNTKELPKHVAEQLLISFKSAAEAQNRSQLFKKYKLIEKEQVGSSPLYLVSTPKTASLKDLISKIEKENGIKYVETNMLLQTQGF